MLLGACKIRLARLEEAPLAASWWSEAAAWQHANGKPGWSPHEIDLEAARRRIADGELHIGFEAGAAFGCLALQADDAVYWPEAPAGAALYVHKLAVGKAFKGRNLGARLIADAAHRAVGRGRPLRLDCAPEPRLMAYYESCGFKRVEAAAVYRDGFWVVRYERT